MQSRSWNVFIVAICIVIVCVIGYQLLKYYSMQPPPLPVFGPAPDFSLLSQDRHSVTRNDYRGNVVIADFIFTECAGPCPLMSAEMSEFQSSLVNDPKIHLLSFSVDPETDTPEVLKEYSQRFHADSKKWTFLTGDKVAIYNLTRSGFHLTVETDSNSVTHSTKYVLIDKKSMIRGYYDTGDKASLDRMLSDARTLVKE
jgi:protein SCO1